MLAVDVTPEMIAALEARFGAASTLGNEPSVRSWLGDILDLPAYQVSRFLCVERVPCSLSRTVFCCSRRPLCLTNARI